MAEVTKSIGKVAMTPKGNYGNTLSYERLDVVFWDGSAYVCIKDAPPNNYPSTENSPYWMLLAKRGYTSIVPKTATLKSEMVDEHYAYVYIGSESGMTNGDWYYYDSHETDWVSGGAYNPPFSTDTDLTKTGRAADAKVVGDKFATTMYYKGTLAVSQDLDTIIQNGSYYIAQDTASAWYNDSQIDFPYSGACRLHVFGGEGSSSSRVLQMVVYSSSISYRIKTSATGAWSGWNKIDGDNTLMHRGTLNSSSDLNTLVLPGTWSVFSNSLPSNYPFAGDGRVVVIGSSAASANTKVQIAFRKSSNQIMVRQGTDSSVWGSWRAIGDTDTTLSVAGMAADAKATGDAIGALNSAVGDVESDTYNNMKYLVWPQEIALTSDDFEQGRYDYNTGGKITTPAHIRTRGKYRVDPLKPLLTSVVPSGVFSSVILQYDENMGFIQGGKPSSNPVALNERTRYVAFGLYKDGSTPTSVSDLTSFTAFSSSGKGLMLTPDCLPVNTVGNLCMNSRLTVHGFTPSQMYNRGTGNLTKSETYSRSEELMPAKPGVGYLSNDPANMTLVCYDKDLAFLGWKALTGEALMPANTAFIGLNVNSLTVENVELAEVNPQDYIERGILLDLGGIGATGANVPGYEKSAYSYRRTAKFIPVRRGSAFTATFASGKLTLFEYDKDRTFIRSSDVVSGSYTMLNDQTEFVKLESYTTPTLVSTPTITVGSKNFISDGSAWEYTTQTNRCYTAEMIVDASKKLLISCASGIDAWVNLSYNDGTALFGSGWMNGNPTLDYFAYLDIASRFSILCKKANGGSFSSGETPITIYELVENPNVSVHVKYVPGTHGSLNKFENRYIPLTYPVHALLGGNRIEQFCYTNGLLRLPPNYDPEGESVPLIYFAHGSSSYQTLNSSSISSSHEPFLQYLLDEGYAIFDCYGWANVLSYTVGSQWAGHIGMACVTQGIEHVLKNYNIDAESIFVMGKSLGGLQALNMAFESGLNVKAVGPFAPAIDTLECAPGYRHLPRRSVFVDFGLPLSGNDEFLRFESSVALNAAPVAYQNIITQNASKFVGYNPAWKNIIGLDPDEMVDSEINSSGYLGGAENVAEVVALKSRICNTPVKIWVAPDDTAVSYPLASAFVQSIKNSGGRAELRTMPEGTGGHSSTDTDPNAPKVASVTTKLGIVHTDVPVAYVEAVEWFRQYE